jgi:hypothetical protein
MSTAGITTLPRTAEAVREVLAEHRPDLHDQFVGEFHTAMAETDDDFNTDRVTRLIGRWWAQAVALLNPDPEVDALQARLAAGDTRDLTESWRPQADGTHLAYRRGPEGGWVFDRVLREGPDAAL